VIACDFHHGLRVVPRHELGAEIGSTIYYGGMVDESQRGLNPGALTSDGLAHTATKQVRNSFEHTRVEKIERDSRTVKWDGRSQPPRAALGARSIRRHQRLHRPRHAPRYRKRSFRIGSFISRRKFCLRNSPANSARATA